MATGVGLAQISLSELLLSTQ